MLGLVGNVGEGLLITAAVAAAVSLVLRTFRTQGVERFQMKWFAFSVLFLPIAFFVGEAIQPFDPTPLRAREQSVVDRRFFRSRYSATRTIEAIRRETPCRSRSQALGGRSHVGYQGDYAAGNRLALAGRRRGRSDTELSRMRLFRNDSRTELA